jgi:glycosyltransferase involved in cell wall biosynthesis
MDSPRTVALSILVPTLGRVESLRELFACLAASSTREPWEVVLIDNATEPSIRSGTLAPPGSASLRLLREGRPGKDHALNRALDEGGLGEIVAVLDDDMSPAPDWLEAVLGACRRLPQFDCFSGCSHVVWPQGALVPAWAGEPLAQGMQFSVFDPGQPGDVEFGHGCPRFPSGNQFWFRRSVLAGGARFPPAWPPEPWFIVDMRARGHRGVFVPEVRVGHRVQPELIDPRKFRERARKFGREMARLDVGLGEPAHAGLGARLRAGLRPARATMELAGWSLLWGLAALLPEHKRVNAQARALWGIAYCKARLDPALGASAR